MFFAQRTLVLLIAMFSTIAAVAQARPTMGMVYGSVDRDAITYACSPVTAREITCEFVQTSVRPKAVPEDLEKVLGQARQQFAQERAPSIGDCKMYSELRDVLHGKRPPPNGKPVSLSATERADTLKMLAPMIAYCDSPTLERFLDIVRTTHDKDRRTCRVSSNAFTQRFRAVQEGGRVSWSVVSEATGECGVVQLSRFEVDEEQAGATFWRYVARKAITNPAGKTLFGASCAGLDERPYAYTWRAKEHRALCEFIEFSPL